MYQTALRVTKDPDDAQDVLQDVFLGLPKALRKYEGCGNLEGWLRRVTERKALMQLRWRRLKREVSIEKSPPASIADSPARIEDRLAIEDAISSLNERQRIVFVLKELEGYTHPEIAELLGISPLASRCRYHRALKRLRRILEDH